MVEHDRAENDIESRRLEWQRLGECRTKDSRSVRALRLLPRAFDHLRRRVDAVYRTCVADAALRRNSERARATANVEHRFTRRDSREIEHPLAHGTLAAECEQL